VLQQILTVMQKATLAVKTRLNVWGSVVAPVFKWAMGRKQTRGYFTEDGNPCDGVKLPELRGRAVHPDQVLMPGKEAEMFLGWAYDISLLCGDFVTFAYCTGLRFSELVALRVMDIDLEHGLVTVGRVARRKMHHRMVFEYHQGKSDNAFRTITIPVGESAWEIAKRRMEGKKPGDLLIPGQRGGLLLSGTWYRTWARLHELALKNGFPKKLTTHGLRHGHATWLLTEGVAIHEVSARLGHGSVKTTWDIYTHVAPRGDARTVKVIGSLKVRRLKAAA
jgi:integrase